MSEPDDDPLNSPSYNPVGHLRVLFSSPANLTHLDEIRDQVSLYQMYIDRQLAAPQEISSEDLERIKRVQNGPDELRRLIDEVETLKQRGQTVENQIREMTSDIKKLDNTKNNLVQSITVLKRLQMLTNAYNQLPGMLESRQYKELSQTLPAVMELMSHFRPFRSIEQIAILSRKVGSIEVEISEQIFKDFAVAIEGNPDHPHFHDIISGLSYACIVLDSLPGNFREQLLNWYGSVQLKEYRNIFKPTEEAGSLENISRRYSYIKRILKRHTDEYSRFFASDWNVTEDLAMRFCKTTREDFKILLTQTPKQELNVQLLLIALQETLEFEQYLEKRFPFAVIEGTKTSIFSKSISESFQPHLNVWIEYQDKILASKINKYKAVPGPSDSEDGAKEAESIKVLPSSADLFTTYRQLFAQTAKLSTGKPLVDLAHLYSRWLNIYSYQVLRALLPERLTNKDATRTACLVLNTADYCYNTIQQLEQRLKDQVDKEYKSQIDFDNEKGNFLETINMSITALVSRVQSQCEMGWREMANTNWVKLTSVGDQSSYVLELRQSIENEAKMILPELNKETHVRMLCDRIVETLIIDFMINIAKCRPISEVSAEQMLLDLYVLKECCLGLPQLHYDPSDEKATEQPSAAYTRHVTKSFVSIETILKVILTQLDPPEGLVQNYFFLVGDKSSANFVKILELKGVPRNHYSGLLELFDSHMKAHENLIDDSPFLRRLQFNTATTNNGTMSGQTISRAKSPIFNTPAGISSFVHHHSNSNSNNSPNTLAPTTSNPKLGTSLLSKEGFERLAHNAENPVMRFNENFRTNIGKLFRRDGGGSSSPSPKQ